MVVPIDQTAAFIHFINELDRETGMQMVSFGHAGDGNVHLCVVRGDRDEERWQKELHENMDRAYRKAYELGGVTSLGSTASASASAATSSGRPTGEPAHHEPDQGRTGSASHLKRQKIIYSGRAR